SERILIATGGKSYPGTGSTGDGYKFAEDLGHTIIPPLPSLIGLKVQENEVRSIAGLALKNVSIKIYKYKGDSESKLKKKNLIEERFGEMLFTHVGISGPIVLDSSRSVVKALEKKENIIASVDWKPAVETHVLQKRVNRIFHENPNVKIKNLFRKLLPQSAIEPFLRKISIDPETPSERILKKDKIMIVENLKNFDFRVIGYESIEKAIITSGGVKISEINPSTMKSKLVDRLFFTGEVIDVDGPTGGYNLQAAWSTGWLAGLSIFRND
ncbi:MAG TPA: aminoacetone oxidase family FAD-binding enzyme, partial [bacterium]|nr:aminoacetone oxidase family FAD-binding enzyme [bacterium]